MSNNRKTIFKSSQGDNNWVTEAEKEIKNGIKIPVVLYLHGCKGFSNQGEIFRSLLLEEGYAFFVPDSFQRPGRKKCGKQGKLHSRVTLRTEEVEYALERIQDLAWVDHSRLILMGFSEGGNTTDNWWKPGFSAHIITGSACTLVDGTPAAPTTVPVLAIVGEDDKYRPSLSCDIQRTIGGSRSIVIPNAGHSIAQYPETRDAIRSFLNTCCS
jgi:dienelactone hydrolase